MRHRAFSLPTISDKVNAGQQQRLATMLESENKIHKPGLKKPSLADTHPEIARQWHPTKNGTLIPETVTRSCKQEIVWVCEKEHEWLEKVSSRTRQKLAQCEYCNSFGFRYPELAKELDVITSAIDPFKITAGAPRKAPWNCSVCHKKYVATINNRVHNGSGCPYCSKRLVAYENSIAFTHPELAKQFNREKNFPLQVDSISQHYRKDVHWICEEGHEWVEPASNRTKRKEANCKVCCSIGYRNKLLALEWHPDNIKSSHEVSANSNEKIKWKCSLCSYIWTTSAANRFRGSGCPGCVPGWPVEKIRSFIASLLPFLDSLSGAALYVLLQQKGLLDMDKDSQGKPFIQALKTGNFPKEELEKFVENNPSLVDKFITNHDEFIEDSQHKLLLEIAEDILSKEGTELPVVETKDVLAQMDSKLTASLDIEAIDFFIKEAVAKIWRHTFANEADAQAQLEQFQGDGEYAKEVKRLFAQGYEGAKKLVVPTGYCFPQSPNLMQRYVAYLVRTRKRIGNWSGTGAGKTLSAILASRVINAALTVICCPNNVIDNWKRQIKDVYPDSVIYTKESMTHIVHNYDKHQYLILNYEFFQQPQSEKQLKAFLSNNIVDFIVIDEIHYSKQREAEKVSKRKQLIATFLSEATSKNDNLCVLGMSATPVINNLFEGKTLIELVTGTYRDDLDTNITIDNCIALYKQFVTHGIREVPQYKYKVNEIFEEIDCSAFIEDIKKHRTIVELESILTKAKLPCIIKHLKPKTIVYTYYRDGIDILLQEAIEQQGWKVAFFNGDDKEGLETFITGDTDVLIASSCIGTGIDRLQYVCNRLIVNCLPWTNSAFEQLKGRIYRQGQVSDVIDIIIPLTYIDINGERRSWCDSKRKRVKYKKDIADVAVDGVIPEGRLRTPEQAHKDLMLWLKRIDEQGTYKLQRSKVSLQFTDDVKPVAIRRIGDLTKMNQRINGETSMETHKRFINHPIEWQDYHEAYRETRKEWAVIPYQEAIKWCQARPHMVIGDFGCGEAFLAQQLQNKVYSFDHVAINDKVAACDMMQVPLNDRSLDAAIFSLSLMGTNWIDYLREAHRCLKLDGRLWIAEPTARINDINVFKELLERLGFDVLPINEMGKFTFVKAIKSERAINEIALKILAKNNFILN